MKKTHNKQLFCIRIYIFILYLFLPVPKERNVGVTVTGRPEVNNMAADGVESGGGRPASRQVTMATRHPSVTAMETVAVAATRTRRTAIGRSGSAA